ncbi:MAG: peptidoglycan bridge formation glycyltransferase FemA/FemB family protein, partial [Candidatus Curtissbacteria bacterium]
MYRLLSEKDKPKYDKLAGHIIQSWEWGEFRKKTGVDVVRIGHFEGAKLTRAYQLTFHKVPKLSRTIGYFPKGPMPDREMVEALRRVGVEKNAAFIKMEPDVEADKKLESKVEGLGLVRAKKALFTKYNFVLDLTGSEENILAGMHQKTRYNIKVAQKRGVEAHASVDDKDFEVYLKLYFETTKRQKYFGHTPAYHRLAWKTLKEAGMARVMIGK